MKSLHSYSIDWSFPNLFSVVTTFIWILIIFVGVCLVCYVMLIRGTSQVKIKLLKKCKTLTVINLHLSIVLFQKNPKMMVPVLVTGIIAIIVVLIIAFINVFNLKLFLPLLFEVGVEAYIWICVYSLYTNLKNSHQGGTV